MKRLFGTDGIRGDADKFPLDDDTVRLIGSSFARQFHERLGRPATFITGRDTRESGERIEQAFHDGTIAENASCESAGVITTPGVAFLTKDGGFDAGVVISASHNPFFDNGIKIFSPSGKKIDDATERQIERDINEKKPANSAPTADKAAQSLSPSELQTTYLNHLANSFKSLKLDGLKVALDCANGAASHLAPRLFASFGADVVTINAEPNGRNINENCGSLHLEHLQAKVLSENADFGAAFDGDADRALFVDEKGTVIDGDATLWIMSRHMKEQGLIENGTVVATVMSNIGLELALETIGLKLIRTAVGDKYVLEELIKTGSEIGGEQSGHVIFPRHSLVGDGMMTSLFVLEAMQAKSLRLSALAAGFVRYPQILVNVRVREKQPFDEVAAIAKMSRQIEEELNGSGRLLLRYSGTENLARVMIEGMNQADIETKANRLADVIRTSLGEESLANRPV